MNWNVCSERPVDLVERKAIEQSRNYILRKHVLGQIEPIYVGRDDVYLLDMLLAANDAREFQKDLDWRRFTASDRHQSAIIRKLEILGEAAGGVSRSSISARGNPLGGNGRPSQSADSRFSDSTPWSRLASGQEELPTLIEMLRPLVPPEEDFK